MDLSGLVERVSKSVVAVVTRGVELWGEGFGSAFSVGGGFYATAYHVVSTAGGWPW